MIKYLPCFFKTKNFLVVIFLFCCAAIIKAQVTTYSDSWGNHGVTLESENPSKVIINFSITQFQFDDIDVDGNILKAVHLPGVFLPNDEGAPDLPGMGKYIALPQGADAVYKIISSRVETISNIDIAPAPRIPKDTETGPLEYKRNQQLYSSDRFYPDSPVLLSSKTQMRGVDVILMGVTPFQYNPVKKELRIYRDLKIEITFNGGNGQFGDNRLRSRWWDPILNDALINYNSLPEINYSNRNVSEALDQDFEYIIITPDNPIYIPWADSIKSFRNAQGIRTGVVTLTQVGGNTTTAIENYVNNAYNNWTIPPAAVLLLADYGTGSATSNGIISPVYDNYCVSDNIYADVNNDHMADIAFARITAQNQAQLSLMVGKFLSYERNPPVNTNFYDKPITAMGWQTERWFQLCSEVVNGFWEHNLGKHPVRENAIYSGTPSTVWSSNQNTNMVVSYFGPSGTGYIPSTPAHLTDWGGNAARINTDINNGAFMLSHRDHGAENGWGEPAYTNSNLSGLNNNDLSFILSINCLTGKFNYSSECFAEAFHRHQKGALGLIAATEVSYSFVNDAYLWGMMDYFWPQFMPTMGTAGQVKVLPAFGNVAGKYFLQASNWPYNTGDKEVTYYLFHHHGDAFSTVYSEMPQNLTVAHNPIIIAGQTTFSVTADQNSLIGLSKNGELIASADGTGSPVNIIIPLLTPGDNILVTVTKQNYFRYTSVVSVIPPEGAFIIYDSHTINDPSKVEDAETNNNGLLDYGETVTLNVGLKNVGTQSATGVTATLKSTDSYITITDSVESFGSFNAGELILKPNAFGFTASSSIPDQHVCNFTIVAKDAVNNWESFFSIKAQSPVIEYVSFAISDPTGNNNGKLDPGETATLNITLKNSGHSKAFNMIGNLSSTDTYITINSNNIVYGDVDTNEVVIKSFSITALEGTPAGHNAAFSINFSGNLGITGTGSFNIIIGQIPVLILDLDLNHNSANVIQASVTNCGITSTLLTSFPADLNLYSSVFTCLGIYSQNYKLTAADGTKLANYLNAGGNLYMEGGDTWYYDTKTAVHSMFNITGVADGSGDLGTLQGQPGSIAQGMTFTYSGENNYIDRLAAVSPAVVMFNNLSPSYGAAVQYNSGTYKTIGASFQFSGLVNGTSPSERDSIMMRMLNYFGVAIIPVELVSFTVETKENTITLLWETATELNNMGFDIEKSNDGMTFIKIADINGKGTTSEKQKYSYTDNNLNGEGKLYYRLKQIDYDGTFAYSETITVDYSAVPLEFSLSQNYPNPFNPSTTIKFAVPKQAEVSLIIYDALGSEVETIVNQKMDPGYYSYQWNGAKFASGVYFYRLTAGEFVSTKKLLILK